MVDFDIAEDGDPQPPENHGNEAHTESYATAADAIDTRRAVNQLVIQNAEQDFELGLELLDYQDGQYEAFVDGSGILSQTAGADVQLGSETSGLGFAAIGTVERVTGSNYTEIDSVREFVSWEIDAADAENGTGVVAGTDGSPVAAVFDAADLSKLGTFEGHSGGANTTDVALSGGYFYSAGSTLKKVDVDTLTEQAEYTGHANPVRHVVVGDTYGYSLALNASSTLEIHKWNKSDMTGTGDTFEVGGGDLSDSDITLSDNGFLYYGEGTEVGKVDPSNMTATGDTYTTQYNILVVAAGGSPYVYVSDELEVAQLNQSDLTATGVSYGERTVSEPNVTADHIYYPDSFNREVVRFDHNFQREASLSTGGDPKFFAITSNYGFTSDGSSGDLIKFSGEEQVTSAEVSHTFQDLGFVPSQVVINDELRQPLPANTTIYYRVEGGGGNVVTVSRSDIDSVVDTSPITSSSISTTAIIERDTTDDPTPQLDSWALYAN